jgi:ketosteroid isomerase-like protein
MEQASSPQLYNKALVQASFERWENGTGGPFELLAPDAEWTIVGSSPLSKTYQSKAEFFDKVILPFNPGWRSGSSQPSEASMPTATWS